MHMMATLALALALAPQLASANPTTAMAAVNTSTAGPEFLGNAATAAEADDAMLTFEETTHKLKDLGQWLLIGAVIFSLCCIPLFPLFSLCCRVGTCPLSEAFYYDIEAFDEKVESKEEEAREVAFTDLMTAQMVLPVLLMLGCDAYLLAGFRINVSYTATVLLLVVLGAAFINVAGLYFTLQPFYAVCTPDSRCFRALFYFSSCSRFKSSKKSIRTRVHRELPLLVHNAGSSGAGGQRTRARRERVGAQSH